MRNVEGMIFAEIAAVLGTSESSVRGLLSKARTRMVELINQQIR
jgi:RNA polymerase sigma-70 factor (ECF subfamily)